MKNLKTNIETLLRQSEKIGVSKFMLLLLEMSQYGHDLSFEQIKKLGDTMIAEYEN